MYWSIFILSFFPRTFSRDVASDRTWSRMLVLIVLLRTAAGSTGGGVVPVTGGGMNPVKMRLNAVAGSVILGIALLLSQEMDSRKEQGAPSHPSPVVLIPSGNDAIGRLQAAVPAAIF